MAIDWMKTILSILEREGRAPAFRFISREDDTPMITIYEKDEEAPAPTPAGPAPAGGSLSAYRPSGNGRPRRWNYPTDRSWLKRYQAAA